MNCTGIIHCMNSNYQIDYFGEQDDCVTYFELWCVRNGVIWAHLFDQKNGQQVATFNDVQGLTTLAYRES